MRTEHQTGVAGVLEEDIYIQMIFLNVHTQRN